MTRKCGDCAMCCEVFTVEAVGLKQGDRCQHSTGHRCLIYQTRPDQCREFQCAWLQGAVPKPFKPNRVGAVLAGVNQADGTQVLNVHVKVGDRPNATFMRWLLACSNSMQIVIVQGDRRTLLQKGREALSWSNKLLQAQVQQQEIDNETQTHDAGSPSAADDGAAHIPA